MTWSWVLVLTDHPPYASKDLMNELGISLYLYFLFNDALDFVILGFFLNVSRFSTICEMAIMIHHSSRG